MAGSLFFRSFALIITLLLAENSHATKNVPFQFGRFVKTLDYFQQLNPLGRFFKSPGGQTQRTILAGKRIWSMDGSNEFNLSWGPLDDVVMGGASESKINVGTSFGGLWTGIVTTANNGGFAGIRTKTVTPGLDMSRCRGVVLRLTGDGQRYKFIARDSEEWNGIAWSYSFDTIKGKSAEVKIPFSRLIPTKFARTAVQSTPFESSRVTALQLTLSKFEYDGGLNPKFKEGPFSVTLEDISTF